MTTVTIHSGDTEKIHIDTYGMLTGDSFVAYELDGLQEQHNNNELTYDDFDWDYDHPAIVKEFAKHSIATVLQAIAHTPYADIITGITYVESGSPKYYNYSSDWYRAEVSYNLVKLNEYVKANYDAILEKANSYSGSDHDENMMYAAIVHILDNAIETDDYNYSMWEVEYEVYSNNTEVKLTKKEVTTN